MAKLNLASMKTANLRSVAPIEEGGQHLANHSAPPLHATQPTVQIASAAPAVSAQPAAVPIQFPVSGAQPIAVPATPAVSAQPATQRSPAAENSFKPRISLLGSKPVTTQPPSASPVVAAPVAPPPAQASLVQAPAVQTASAPVVSAPVAEAPAPVQTFQIQQAAKVSVPEISAVSPTTEASSMPTPEVSSQTVATVPSPEIQSSEAASQTVAQDQTVRTPVEGVDIIEAAKVISGHDEDKKAQEIIQEAKSGDNRSEIEKKAESVEIPEAKKEFFPNLEIDSSLYTDDIYTGIVPEKSVASVMEIRSELPSESEAPTSQPTVIAASEKKSEPIEEIAPVVAIVEEPKVEEVVSAPVSKVVELTKEPTKEAASIQEAVSEAKTDAPAPVPVVAETDPDADAILLEGDVLEPSVSPVMEYVEKVAKEYRSAKEYVESVAKRLSAQRRDGRLAKLYGERKTLVRSVAWAFFVTVFWVGAYAAVTNPIKTSAPEMLPPVKYEVWFLPEHSINKARKIKVVIRQLSASSGSVAPKSVSTGSATSGASLPEANPSVTETSQSPAAGTLPQAAGPTAAPSPTASESDIPTPLAEAPANGTSAAEAVPPAAPPIAEPSASAPGIPAAPEDVGAVDAPPSAPTVSVTASGVPVAGN